LSNSVLFTLGRDLCNPEKNVIYRQVNHYALCILIDFPFLFLFSDCSFVFICLCIDLETTGAVRKTGGDFKEKLRELGGLDAVFEVAMNCHSDMEV
jgi:hypothetical protein